MENSGYLIALGLLACTNILGQGTISTVAGGTGFLDNIPAVQARISGPSALVIDQHGNAYIGDGSRIRKIDATTGNISTVTAQTGAQNLAFDAEGNLVLVYDNRALRLYPGTGILTAIAGMAGDTTPQFGTMAGLATDAAGDIFLTDSYNGKIYKIDATSGAVSTFAGGAIGSGSSTIGDGGPATLAYLGRPSVITVDPFGNVFFAEQDWLRRIDGKTGIITTIAPNDGTGSSGDGGPYSKAVFANITALATDAKGNLYIGDQQYVRKIDWNSGLVSTTAGSGQQQYVKDGTPALQANLSFLTGLAVDAQGNVWIADSGNARVFIVASSTNLISTVAGTSANGDGGPALGAVVSPLGLAIDSQGDLYFYDRGIRRVDHTTGFISTVIPYSALAYSGYLGNGAAPITVDSNGNLFLSQQTILQRIDAATGAVTVVAGDGFGQYGEGGSLGDGGSATKAQVTPAGVAIDSSGNLYIADYWYSRIRRVDATTGIITTVAGTGQQTFSGMTGPAAGISIGVPTSIAIAPNGDIYWTTVGWVLKMNSAGILSIAAGNGGCGYSGDGGSALLAPLCDPSSISFDGAGNLFVSESTCDCVRRVEAASGVIQTVAGTGSMAGSSGDGIPATQAAVMPAAVAFSGGVLYIVDSPPLPTTQGRIRAVTPAAPPPLPQPPSISGIGDAVGYRSALSPGAIVSVFGNYLGGPSSLSGQTGTNGLITNVLGGDQVTFNGTPGPLLYVSAGQINTIVPYSTQLGTATLDVTTAGGNATLENLPIYRSSLNFYPGLVFNPDGTLNSAAHPAPKGATLVMYGTGMGQVSPPVQDGSIIQAAPFPMPETPFLAWVFHGATAVEYVATISYLGPLPGFVAGAVQANIQIPATVPAGKSIVTVGQADEGASLFPYIGPGSFSQTIYMLSDPPVLSSVSPVSPISQSVGVGNYLTLTGQNLDTVTSVSFFLNGQAVDLSFGFSCTANSCTLNVFFGGIGGEYGVTVTNAANQVSNQLTFSVQPYSPPTVTSVSSYPGAGPVVATKGPQFVNVMGTNFLASDTVTVYYNNAAVATFNSSSTALQVISSQFIYLDFDFQGNAGQYAVQVSGTNGSSGLFNFTVPAP